MAEQTFNDSERKCPYCGHTHQPDSESFNEDSREEKCDNCGKSYHAHDSFSVTHYATPDCELNGEVHDWQDKYVRGRSKHPFCRTCNKCMPISMLPNAELSGGPARI